MRRLFINLVKRMIDYYSTHCGVCETFSWLMEARDIHYHIIHTDKEVMEAAEKYGAETFPFAVIDGKFYNTQELLNYILEYNK